MARVNIPQYGASKQIEPGSAPRVQLSDAVGAALKGVGSAIGNFGEAAAKRQEDKENFQATNDYNALQQQLAEDLQNQQDQHDGDGEDFHNDFVDGSFKPRRDAFMERLPKRLQEKYGVLLSDDAEQPGSDYMKFSTNAAERESGIRRNWFKQTIDAQSEQLLGGIDADPKNFDMYRNNGIELIEQSGLLPSEKRAAKLEWERKAGSAYLAREAEDSPENVLRLLGADPRQASPAAKKALLVASVKSVESAGDPNAVSPAGAVGLMQVKPETAAEIAQELKDKNFPANTPGGQDAIVEYLKDPKVSERYGTHYLDKMLRKYGGDMPAALVAYNGGPSRANAWLKAGRDDRVLPKETADYYKKVLSGMGTQPSLDENGKPVSGTAPQGGYVDIMSGIPAHGDDAMSYRAIDVAKKFAGANETDNTKVLNAFIERSAGIEINVKDTPWCAGWVNAVLGASGTKGTGSLSARSFLSYGKPTDEPKMGDIVVLSRGDRNGPYGHVGFYAGEGADGKIKILGGNQGGSSQKGGGVTVAEYDASRVLGYRVPPKASSGATPPENTSGFETDPRFASLPYSARRDLMTSAETRIAKRDGTVAVTAVQKVQVRQSMGNELARYAATGKGSPDFNEAAISDTLGEDDYIKWAEKRDVAVSAFKAKSGVNMMSSEEMATRLSDYEVDPNADEYSADVKVRSALVNEIDRVTKLRAKDPAGAAMEFDDVKEAKKALDEQMAAGSPEPAQVRALVDLMLERQKLFDIPPSARAPIPRDWALGIGRMLSEVPAVSPDVKLADVRNMVAVRYQELEKVFGDQTDEVVVYALSEYNGVEKSTAELIGAFMTAISLGKDPFSMRGAAAAAEADKEQLGVFGRIGEYLFGDDEPVDETEGASPEALLRKRDALRSDEDDDS